MMVAQTIRYIIIAGLFREWVIEWMTQLHDETCENLVDVVILYCLYLDLFPRFQNFGIWTCVTWLVGVWHDAFVCVMRRLYMQRLYMCEMIDLFVLHDACSSVLIPMPRVRISVHV